MVSTNSSRAFDPQNARVGSNMVPVEKNKATVRAGQHDRHSEGRKDTYCTLLRHLNQKHTLKKAAYLLIFLSLGVSILFLRLFKDHEGIF